MNTMRDFIKNYDLIIQYIHDAGFNEPTIFKGFCKNEENHLFILVKDNPNSTTSANKQLPARILILQEKLRSILSCEIKISLPSQLEERYLKKIDASNSVKLEAKDTTIKKLETVFGLDWVFTSQNDATVWPSPIETSKKNSNSKTDTNCDSDAFVQIPTPTIKSH